MSYLILIVGFVLLIKGADIFVDGSSSIAKKMGIPAVVVGLTIVSVGTSAPELAVSLISAISGNNEIAVGNVIGSNIFNGLVVLGVTAIISPMLIKKSTIRKDFFINIAITVLLFFMAFDSIYQNKENIISRIDGIILILICIAYTISLIIQSKNAPSEGKTTENINVVAKLIMIVLGVFGIVFGGKLVVDSATEIAISLGMSEKLVGLTIVAIGTSLPELVTSVVAAIKGETEIALGNVLGSNIFNIILILGMSAGIKPINVSSTMIFDFIFLIVATLIIGTIIFISKKSIKRLGRIEGIFLVMLYIGYTAYIIMRN